MFKGNNQKVWFDNELLATLTKAEAKAAFDYEEIETCGSYDTEYEFTGQKVTGTLTYKKTNSNVLAKAQEALKSGDMPRFKITGANMQVNGQTERVNLYGVRITEVAILNAEAKKVAEEEIPFNATSWELADKVVS
jgi:hypothetical protein